MWALSFIMVIVGQDITVDKSALSEYAWDYLIAMTAAGFPWLFVVAQWFMLAFDSMAVDEVFLVVRFAAPTNAGILFSMLEVAGPKETWLFQKARMLAIFDGLDTIILMVLENCNDWLQVGVCWWSPRSCLLYWPLHGVSFISSAFLSHGAGLWLMRPW
jgi:hypothetical protein